MAEEPVFEMTPAIQYLERNFHDFELTYVPINSPYGRKANLVHFVVSMDVVADLGYPVHWGLMFQLKRDNSFDEDEGYWPYGGDVFVYEADSATMVEAGEDVRS